MMSTPVQAPTGAGKSRHPFCALCYSRVRPVLDLGEQPLANALLDTPDQQSQRYPLRLGVCTGCRHVQLCDQAPPEAMFSSYTFRTGASDPARAHFRGLAVQIAAQYPRGTVCDVGSNDGTLAGPLREMGLQWIGVDPSDAAREVPGTLPKYFNRRTAGEMIEDGIDPDVVVMANVLAHTPDPAGMVQAAADLLDHGYLVVEAPYLGDMYRRGDWSSIYHEHMHFFDAHALQRMLVPVGFAVARVDRLPVHGGSLRIWAERVINPQRARVDPAWLALLKEENEHPYDWEDFQHRCYQSRLWLREQCATTGRLVAYGAPAKLTVMLNAAGIRPEYATDTTPAKQGKFIPGVRVPIVAPKELEARPPDKLLLGAWNYWEAIRQREPRYEGKWVVPFCD